MTSRKIIVPLPDRDFDVTEVAVPWRLLTRAGHQVIFATEAGATPQCDPLLLTGVIFGQLGAEAEAKSFYAEMTADAAFTHPLRWTDIEPAAYDAMLLPGGHAPGMRQYLGSELLQARVAAFWKLDRPVAAICHGVLVLARAKDPGTGRSVIEGMETTCLPKYMEGIAYGLSAWKLGRYYRTYPAYVQDEVRAALGTRGRFVRGPISLVERGSATNDRPAFVHRSGRYVSARWPGDAYLFSKVLMEVLEAMVG